ncbi:MAG TPA: acyl-CoA dehydrogenase family protein [Frankiaceae bacterium]|jgi:alkylation response protein AidB-like acyl-CoA dehydrogenase|nr:acyl-CoA dehydrogenase family protein [Frankiaceae bacterium]
MTQSAVFAANSDLATPDAAVVEAARKLAPFIEAEAVTCERQGTMPQSVVSALRESGLFSIMVPRELGGSEVSAVTALAVFEELTAADASIGWSQMANASSSAFSAYLGDEAVEKMFADEPAIIAGQFGPRGMAVAVDGGYQVQGRYAFGSGSGHADWIGGGAIEMDGAAPRMVDGRPILRAFFVPRSQVEFLGGWDVMGLIGTGSFDYAISEQVVPESFTFEITNAHQYRGGSLYGLGVLGMTSVGHAGFALGVSRRAVDEILVLAGRKKRMGHTTTVAEVERFQYELGRVTAMLKAARALLYETFAIAQQQVKANGTLEEDLRLGIRQATTHAAHVSAAVVDVAYHWSGADGIRPGVIQRLYRDTNASTQHIFVDDGTFTEYGRHLLMTAGSLPGLAPGRVGSIGRVDSPAGAS